MEKWVVEVGKFILNVVKNTRFDSAIPEKIARKKISKLSFKSIW